MASPAEPKKSAGSCFEMLVIEGYGFRFNMPDKTGNQRSGVFAKARSQKHRRLQQSRYSDKDDLGFVNSRIDQFQQSVTACFF